MRFRLAHVSDPHLALGPGEPALWPLTFKQLLALWSWRRRDARQDAVLEALCRDVADQAPDHIAVTGDLVNLGTEMEFTRAAAWLGALGPVAQVSVAPGNHDATRAVRWQRGVGRWSAWMQGDAAVLGAPPFPYMRRCGEVAIVGLSSAVPTPVFSARGRLGGAQLERAATMLAQAGAEGLFRIVLIHHPPLLHGHYHRSMLAALPRPVPVIGAASAGRSRAEAPGWRLHDIVRDSEGWRLVTRTRCYDAATGGFVTGGEWRMRLVAGAGMVRKSAPGSN